MQGLLPVLPDSRSTSSPRPRPRILPASVLRTTMMTRKSITMRKATRANTKKASMPRVSMPKKATKRNMSPWKKMLKLPVKPKRQLKRQRSSLIWKRGFPKGPVSAAA